MRITEEMRMKFKQVYRHKELGSICRRFGEGWPRQWRRWGGSNVLRSVLQAGTIVHSDSYMSMPSYPSLDAVCSSTRKIVAGFRKKRQLH